MREITIGLSPCPNDTFIFDALLHQKIDTGDFNFKPVLEDVETLNQWAETGKLDITKLSYPAFFKNLNQWSLLDSGSALGKGVGPLLISKSNRQWSTSEIEKAVIAIPGVNTTANLLFNFSYPYHSEKKFMIFSDIENAVLNDEAELGVIIHENRFTYQDKGLNKVADLGEFWESKMKMPIPLGGIAANKKLDQEVAKKTEQLIKESIQYAWSHYPELPDFVLQHAQSMEPEVMKKHIELYVNDYSLSLGTEGKQAVQLLFSTYLLNKDVDADLNQQLFID